jgi:type IV secretory pathway TrbF-like protein
VSTSEAISPYIAARHEWDERYGSMITQAHNWRAAFQVASVIALVAVAGATWLAVHSRTKVFVVALDHLGRSVAAGYADQSSVASDDRVRRSSILNWVESLRTVTSDTIAQAKAIRAVYAQIAQGSAAMNAINDFYRNGDPPQTRGKTETVSVEVNTVLPTSDRSYEVDWTETTRDLQGVVTATARLKGSFTIAVDPPADEATARMNPLGIYVTNASWSRVL